MLDTIYEVRGGNFVVCDQDFSSQSRIVSLFQKGQGRGFRVLTVLCSGSRVQSNFDKRDRKGGGGEKAYKRFPVRSESCHKHNVNVERNYPVSRSFTHLF
jgi:hypothetical protein